MKTLEIGSISHGTHRNEDLIPAFLDALESVDPEHVLIKDYNYQCQNARMSQEMAAHSALKRSKPWSMGDWYNSQDASYMIEDLFDALNEYCPPYCYFGACEGDGADFGVWVSWEALDEATRYDNDVVKIKSGDPWPCREEILEVNDHGNATLWVWNPETGRHEVAWEVV